MSAMLVPTVSLAPSQTVGPFFHDCLLRPDACRNVLAQEETAGEHIHIEGCVLDGDGLGVPDALVEIWQANGQGRYNHPADTRAALALDAGFSGFGRAGTDDAGRYWFETIRPGAAPIDLSAGAPMQAPHICVMVCARGLLNHLATRLYFADELANETDPILQRVPADRRATLLAEPQSVEGRRHYRWDIVLQGRGETVFFNL